MAAAKSFVIVALFAGSLIWTAALGRPDGRYHIWNVSTRSQLSLLIKSPLGNFAVVNTASSKVLPALSERLPFYDREIDLKIVTGSNSSDKLSQYFRVGEVWNLAQEDISKGNLSSQREWEGVSFQSWSVVRQGIFIRLTAAGHSLIYLSQKDGSFWEAVPYDKNADAIISSPSETEIVW